MKTVGFTFFRQIWDTRVTKGVQCLVVKKVSVHDHMLIGSLSLHGYIVGVDLCPC